MKRWTFSVHPGDGVQHRGIRSLDRIRLLRELDHSDHLIAMAFILVDLLEQFSHKLSMNQEAESFASSFISLGFGRIRVKMNFCFCFVFGVVCRQMGRMQPGQGPDDISRISNGSIISFREWSCGHPKAAAVSATYFISFSFLLSYLNDRSFFSQILFSVFCFLLAFLFTTAPSTNFLPIVFFFILSFFLSFLLYGWIPFVFSLFWVVSLAFQQQPGKQKRNKNYKKMEK